MKNIVIVGFMGTGKTAVSRALAGQLDKAYVASDELIEKREAMSISNIFKENGEAHFRAIEKKVIEEISEKSDQVIDAGGGVVLDEENMANLKRNGVVICLWADAAVIYERVKRCSHRPLLNVADPVSRIKELLAARRAFYKKADHHIDTTTMDVESVAGEIKKIVETF